MRPRTLAAAAVLAALTTFSACSAGGDDSGGDSADAGAMSMPAEAELDSQMDAPMDEGGAADLAVDEAASRETADPADPAVIHVGNVALTADDVAQAAFDVQQVVDEYAGQVTEQKTGTDRDGEVRTARMVVRIPADDFDEAFADLEGVADLVTSNSRSEDVTDEVIDTEVRIRAQRRSLERVEVLLDRAQSIRDIVAIEAQLTRRQGDLDSLEQRAAWLADQTSMSTVTVTVERTPDEPKAQEKEDDTTGFLGGLQDGWHGLTVFAGGLATLAGLALPWLAVLALLAVPLLVWLRTRRRRVAAA